MQITRLPAAFRITTPHLRRCVAVAGFSLLFAAGSVRAQFAFRNIADENTAAPGRSDNFTDTVNASLSGNTVTFIGTYNSRGAGNPVDYGIYTANATGTPVVARVADNTNIASDGNNQNPVILSSPVVSGSTVTFTASIPSNNYNGASRIYTGTAGVTGVNQIANLNTAVPGQTGQTFAYLGNSTASGSNVVFTGNYSGGAGLYLNTAGTTGISRVVDSSSTFGAGQTAGFTLVAGPSASGSNVAFGAIYNQTATDSFYNLDGVFTTAINGTGLALRAGTANAVPGQSGKNFTGLGSPTLKGTNLVFAAAFSGGAGIYQETLGGTVISKVADTSTLVPTKGTLTFTRFAGYATDGTNVVFTGYYGTTGGGSSGTSAGAPPASQSGEGIFLESGGSLAKILTTGDTLFGSTVTDVGVGGNSYDGNEIAFSYILANGEAGVGVLDIPVPEPATWLGGALLVGLGAVGLHRQQSKRPIN